MFQGLPAGEEGSRGRKTHRRPRQGPRERRPREARPREGRLREGTPREGTPRKGRPRDGRPREGRPQPRLLAARGEERGPTLAHSLPPMLNKHAVLKELNELFHGELAWSC